MNGVKGEGVRKTIIPGQFSRAEMEPAKVKNLRLGTTADLQVADSVGESDLGWLGGVGCVEDYRWHKVAE